MIQTAKTLLTMLLLLLVMPINAAIVAVAVVQKSVKRWLQIMPTPARVSHPKSILISGGKMTKALQLARLFHQAGHRVVLVESHSYWLVGHRFSRAVDCFYTLPKSGASDYEGALLDLIKREKIDVYVPVCSPASSLHDSRAIFKLAPHCEVLHVHPDTILQLDDKFQFFEAAGRLQLAVPKSFLITDPQQVESFDFTKEVRQFILKSIAYDPVRRLDMTKLPAASKQATADFVRS